MSPHHPSSPEEVDLRAQLPPGRHRLSREYVRKNQDDRLAAATIATMAARGFDETTVKDIVAAARLSRRTFYQRFPNKTACFLATYELIASHLSDAADLAVAEVPDWPSRPAATIEAALAVFAANTDLALFLLAAPLRADAAEPLAAHRRFLERAARRLCDGAPADLVPPPHLATALVAGLAALLVDAVESGGGEDLASLAPRLTELFLVGVDRVGTRPT
jgi:AcrR family transcriptional regulator